jgi:hypothetical protein
MTKYDAEWYAALDRALEQAAEENAPPENRRPERDFSQQIGEPRPRANIVPIPIFIPWPDE